MQLKHQGQAGNASSNGRTDCPASASFNSFGSILTTYLEKQAKEGEKGKKTKEER
jgi:hypothetical protein